MQRFLLTAFVFLTTLGTTYGQIELTFQKSLSLQGLTAPRLVGDVILVDEQSKPVVAPVALVTVKTDYKFVDVTAKKSLFEEAILVKVSDTEYLLGESGRWVIQVTAFDPERGIAKKSTEVVVGDPTQPPTDPTDPKPPTGDYDAIAQDSRKNADQLNDQSTRLALSQSLLLAIASVPANASLDQAKKTIVNAIENTLLLRSGQSRTADWNAIWRRPLNASVLATGITATTEYLKCMLQVAEGLR